MNGEREARDHALSRVYREGAWPEPGRQIDQAILAASRRAARARHPLLWRWAPPFAVAATVVLTSAIVLKAYREQPEAVSPAAPEMAQAPRARQSAPEPKPDAKEEARAKVEAAPPTVATPQGFSSNMDALEAERLERAKRDLNLKEVAPPGQAANSREAKLEKKKVDIAETQRRADVPQAPRPAATSQPPASAPMSVFGAAVPSAAPAARVAPKPVVPPAQSAPQTVPSQAAEAAPAAQAARAPAPAEDKAPQPAASAGIQRNVLGANVAGAVVAKPADRSAETWIEDIRKLMKEGKSVEAGEQIAEFKKRYPDYTLPEDLR